MTSNDAQIDVLLRRYAGQSRTSPATEHLDADELNAFAEGSLPDAARARYVSHLIDCDNCRQIVSQLAISSGVVVAAEAAPAASGYSWWKRLSGFFPPMTLRYAAFAMVLITAAGVVFLVTRRPRESNLVAQNERREVGQQGEVKPPNDEGPKTAATSPSGAFESKSGSVANPTPSSQASPIDQIAKLDQSKTGDSPALPMKPAKEAEASSLADNKKAAAPPVTETVPSYAPPPPPGETRIQTQSREQQTLGGVATASGPRKSEQPADQAKQMDRGRGAEPGKDIRADDSNARLAANQPAASKRSGEEKVKGPRRDMDNLSVNRNSNEVSASKSQGIVAPKPAASEDKAPETRSAGGRKFKRQGNAWVDAKFKASMSVKNISRGSSEFDALDSGLRSIAQQLGGEVIVVWKGKAYQIR